MPDKTVPPASAPTDAEARETERKLFEGLARVRMFPMDPSGPGQTPGQMLPLSNVLRKVANQPGPQPELLGPIEQAMRDHPGLSRAKAEEMAEAFGFSTGTSHDSQPLSAEGLSKPAPSSAPQSNEHEIAWAKEREALLTRWRDSGLTVTEKAPPQDMTQFTATFPRALQKPTKRKN